MMYRELKIEQGCEQRKEVSKQLNDIFQLCVLTNHINSFTKPTWNRLDWRSIVVHGH